MAAAGGPLTEEHPVHRRNPRADVRRLSQVLAGIPFPAAKWQLIMHAEEYGADAASRAELWALPASTYPDLRSVLAALGLHDAPPAVWYPAAPTAQAASQERPVH